MPLPLVSSSVEKKKKHRRLPKYAKRCMGRVQRCMGGGQRCMSRVQRCMGRAAVVSLHGFLILPHPPPKKKKISFLSIHLTNLSTPDTEIKL